MEYGPSMESITGETVTWQEPTEGSSKNARREQ